MMLLLKDDNREMGRGGEFGPNYGQTFLAQTLKVWCEIA